MNKGLIINSCLLILLVGCSKKQSVTANEVTTSNSLDLYNSIAINDSLSYIFGGDDYAANSLIEFNKKTLSAKDVSLTLSFNKAFKNAAIASNNKVYIGGISGVLVSKRIGDGNNWSVFQTPSYEGITGLSALNNILLCSTRATGSSIELRDTNLNLLKTFAVSHDLQDIAWLSPNKSIACGTGAIMLSKDGGITWEYTHAKGDIFNSIAILNELNIYVSGLGGSLWKSTDGGATWKKVLGLNTARVIQKIIYDAPTKQILITGHNGLCCLLNTDTDEMRTLQKFTNANLFGGEILNSQSLIVYGEKGALWHINLNE